ncbi:MAG: ABC transporter permease subunit [Chloroflexota bacterium]|nr:ABC transporter permease subunit [Chloroflexota bacterium]
MRAVFWKELTDYFSSWRFIIVVFLIWLVSLFSVYTASQTIIGDVSRAPTEAVFLRLFTTSGANMPSFLFFISFFGPLIGIVFGFDAINGERTKGTLSRVLSQPLFRDSVINGKFLAGLAVIAIMLACIILEVAGLGLVQIGIPPSAGEIARLLCFYLIGVFYVGFWLGLGMLFSVLFRSTIISAQIPIFIWLIFVLFTSMIAGMVSDWIEPVDQNSEYAAIQEHERIETNVQRLSPVTLFNEASETILSPERRTLRGIFLESELYGMMPGSVSLKQSLLLVWQHIIGLIALTSICFAVSYIKFMREEIRAT